jgi:hypothetical protein
MKIRLRSTEVECRHAGGQTAEVAEADRAREPAHKRTHEPKRSTSTFKEAES